MCKICFLEQAMKRNEGLPMFWHTLPTTKSILELNLNIILHSINPKRIQNHWIQNMSRKTSIIKYKYTRVTR
jgi:hypothetical protein